MRKLCIVCGKPVSRNASTYCSTQCQRDKQYRDYIDKWLAGSTSGNTVAGHSRYIRRWLIEQNNGKCMNPNCGWDWAKPCIVELEHTDGNFQNNRPNNVSLLCPNCHSQTPTYKGKNKGCGRFWRTQRYRSNLSY